MSFFPSNQLVWGPLSVVNGGHATVANGTSNNTLLSNLHIPVGSFFKKMIDNKLPVGTMVEYVQRTFLLGTASFGHEEVTSKKIGLIYGTEMHLSHYGSSTIEKYKILDCETHTTQVAQEQDVTEISDETNKK